MQTLNLNKSSKELLFEVYYALRRDKLDEAEDQLRKIRVDNLGRTSRLRYYTLAGEIKLKQGQPKEAQQHLLQGMDETARYASIDGALMDQVNYLLGDTYYKQGYYIEAYKIHQPLLHRYTRHDVLGVKLGNSVGMELIILGNIFSPLEYFRRSLSLGHLLKQAVEEARSCLGRGICFMELGQRDWAMLHAQQGLQLLQGSRDWDLLAKLHNLTAQILILDNQADQAEASQLKALEYGRKTGDKILISNLYAVMAQVQAAQKRWEASSQTIAQAEEITKGQTNNLFLAYNLIHYAAILNRNGREIEADLFFKRGFHYLKDCGDIGVAISESFKLYSESLVNRGQHQEAVKAMRRALEIREAGLVKIAA